MKTTPYFEEQFLRKRPYIKIEWCEQALRTLERIEVQEDSRRCYWVYIPEWDKHLRVVTLPDGVTIHNAFFDRDF